MRAAKRAHQYQGAQEEENAMDLNKFTERAQDSYRHRKPSRCARGTRGWNPHIY